MSRWRPEVLALGLSVDTLAGVARQVQAPAGGWGAASLQAALDAVRTPAAGQPTRLLLCPDLCRHFTLQPSTGLARFGELRTLAAMRAGQLFGGPSQAWSVVADWNLARPVVCAAMPTLLLQALQQVAQQRRLVLSVESAALAAWAALSRGPLPLADGQACVAWVSPAHLMLASTAAGAMCRLRCIRRQADAAPAALAALALREAAQDALRSGAEPGPAAAAPLVLAWAGRPPALATGEAWPVACDAAGSLPTLQPAESEAAWACRLAGLSGSTVIA